MSHTRLASPNLQQLARCHPMLANVTNPIVQPTGTSTWPLPGCGKRSRKRRTRLSPPEHRTAPPPARSAWPPP
eukprot:scaffold7958_cov45-Phaeocystis_antarctica.AAC.2